MNQNDRDTSFDFLDPIEKASASKYLQCSQCSTDRKRSVKRTKKRHQDHVSKKHTITIIAKSNDDPNKKLFSILGKRNQSLEYIEHSAGLFNYQDKLIH